MNRQSDKISGVGIVTAVYAWRSRGIRKATITATSINKPPKSGFVVRDHRSKCSCRSALVDACAAAACTGTILHTNGNKQGDVGHG